MMSNARRSQTKPGWKEATPTARTLVAGCAALYDLIGRIDGRGEEGAVGILTGGPAQDGRWLPGGAAPTVAMAMAKVGAVVGLWHPLPRDPLDSTRWRLESAGVTIIGSPCDAEPSRCIVLRDGARALAWSSTPSELDQQVASEVLDGVDHLVICPRWGAWADALVAAAHGRGVPTSLVGLAPPPHIHGPWRLVVCGADQLSQDSARRVDAEMLVVTRGPAGSSIRIRDEWLEISAVTVEVVDETGAGDVFAGTLLGELDRGATVQAAATSAARAAAECCRAWGAQATLITRPDGPSTTDRLARARGALWGLACGDAFGMPASFLPPTG
jgi:sugar/nucleoside kinase (ribokinase family)